MCREPMAMLFKRPMAILEAWSDLPFQGHQVGHGSSAVCMRADRRPCAYSDDPSFKAAPSGTPQRSIIRGRKQIEPSQTCLHPWEYNHEQDDQRG